MWAWLCAAAMGGEGGLVPGMASTPDQGWAGLDGGSGNETGSGLLAPEQDGGSVRAGEKGDGQGGLGRERDSGTEDEQGGQTEGAQEGRAEGVTTAGLRHEASAVGGAARPELVVQGKVLARGTRQPLAGASVRIGAGEGTETAADGSFTLAVTPGTHPLRVQCPGYQPLSQPLVVSPGGAPLIVRLEPRTSGERYETVVTAAPAEASEIPLRQEELTHTAGSLGDPFRVIESLPGVAQTTWPLPFYAIRGANPGDTGFFIDGVRVPALFHFALGPSVINPFFLDKLDFYPGGYPIDYGRYISGIVSAETAAPATDRLHVSADVRLFDAGGIAAMPFDNGKGTIAVAGRYSYTGLILSAFSSDYSVNYWDYQVRIEHTLGPGKLTLFAFGSGDHLDEASSCDQTTNCYGFLGEPNAIAPGLANLSFHRLQLRWAGALAGGRLTLAVVGGEDDSTISITSLFALPVGSRSYSVAPRIGEQWKLASWADLEVGADSEFQVFRPTSLVSLAGGFLAANYGRDLFHNRDAASSGVYAGMTFRVGERLQISPGLRYDGYFEQDASAYAPSPRLLVRLRVGPHDWLKVSAGEFSEMPSLPIGVPGFESFGLGSYGLQRSRQVSVGLESALEDRLGLDLNLDTSLFYQRLHVSDLRDTLIPDPEAPDLIEMREGDAYGFELMLRRPMKHQLYGWLAYTLSWSFRVIDGFIAPSDWDERHILNLVVGYRLPARYSLSARFHYNSGRPYPLYDERTQTVVGYTQLAAFPQLDLRVDKRFIFDNFVLEAYLELVNATMSREEYDVKLDNNGSLAESSYRLVLPSLGVHIEW